MEGKEGGEDKVKSGYKVYEDIVFAPLRSSNNVYRLPCLHWWRSHQEHLHHGLVLGYFHSDYAHAGCTLHG